MVERGIEVTVVVLHFHQTADVDDVFLVDLNELPVERQEGLIGHITFQPDGILLVGYYCFPHPLVVVVLEYADVLNLYQLEIDGVQIEQQAVVDMLADAVVLALLLLWLLFVGNALQDHVQFLVFDGLHQVVEGMVSESPDDVLAI